MSTNLCRSVFNLSTTFLNTMKYQLNVARKFWTPQISNSNGIVTLYNNSSGEMLLFPSVWLRDNCQCNDCFDKQSYSRLVPLQNLDPDIRPIYCEIVNNEKEGSVFEVKWPDQHESVFQLDWLKDRSFSSKRQSNWLSNVYRFNRIPWSSDDYLTVISKFSYHNLVNTENELLKFLSNLDTYGIAIIENAGLNKCQLDKLIKQIGFSKKTYYGEYYVVNAKMNAQNVAYLPKPLQLHVDLPYYEYIPGVNLLHYVVQSEAEQEGQNQLSDGLYACNIMKHRYPEQYAILAKTPIEWTDIGQDDGYQFHSIYRAPVICEELSGTVSRINFSQPQRDSHFCVPIDIANKWYKAMKVFINILHHQDTIVSLKMNAGDILAFDNARVLHGRNTYSSDRCILGAYLDWDIIRSKIRVLRSTAK